MLYSAGSTRFVRVDAIVPPVTTLHSSSAHAQSSASATPAMRQYLDVKRQHRDAIVLFRMGDFYEMFYEDALTAARVLELTLTSRAKDAGGVAIPMCGVPFHARRDVPRAPRAQGLSRRDLRSGRGSAQGQGHRPARGHARGLAGHVHRRRRISTRASRRFSRRSRRAGARRRRGASRFSTSRPASSPPPSSPAPGAEAALVGRARGASAARSCSPADARQIDGALRPLASPRVTRVDGWTFEPARARASALRAAPHGVAGRLRPRRRAGGRGGRRRHRRLPARDAARRARARPRHLAARRRRRAARSIP